MNQNNISYNYNDLSQPFINNHENYKEQKKDFLYSMKLRTAILGFILYLILSSSIAFKILHLITSNIFNNQFEIINEKKEPSILSKLFMASIIFIILFIF